MQIAYYCLNIESKVVTMSWTGTTDWRDKKSSHLLGNVHLWNREDN
jgi:hypothetical protein